VQEGRHQRNIQNQNSADFQITTNHSSHYCKRRDEAIHGTVHNALEEIATSTHTGKDFEKKKKKKKKKKSLLLTFDTLFVALFSDTSGSMQCLAGLGITTRKRTLRRLASSTVLCCRRGSAHLTTVVAAAVVVVVVVVILITIITIVVVTMRLVMATATAMSLALLLIALATRPTTT
jgi:hypothetical protein